MIRNYPVHPVVTITIAAAVTVRDLRGRAVVLVLPDPEAVPVPLVQWDLRAPRVNPDFKATQVLSDLGSHWRYRTCRSYRSHWRCRTFRSYRTYWPCRAYRTYWCHWCYRTCRYCSSGSGRSRCHRSDRYCNPV